MSLTSKSFIRWAFILFATGLIALVSILGATAWLIDRTSRHADAVVKARETRAEIVDLKSVIQDAETGQRGFLLTGKETYLEPFDHAVRDTPARFQSLRGRLRDDPQAAARLDGLDDKLAAKFDEMDKTIALMREGRSDAALALVDQDLGKHLMDDIRTTLDQLIKEADDNFAGSVSIQRATAKRLQIVELIGAVVVLAVTGGLAWLVLRYTRDIANARIEIEALNEGLEQKVRERTIELGRANEEIQRFAYIVTHDLRAPLVNIMGFTSELEASLAPIQTLVKDDASNVDGASNERELAEARIAANEDLPEAIGFIRSSTRKMDNLINAILKLSREGRRQLKPETIRLEPLLTLCADAVRHQVAEAGGEIALDIGVASIVSDRLSMEQVIGNLLDNAVKYAQAGRPLRLAISVKPALAKRVDIAIEDNGRGIAEQDHERVFELFRRSGSQDRPGEGIGLAHVRSSVRSLGGEITVTSRLGEGTTFRINLPRDLSASMRS